MAGSTYERPRPIHRPTATRLVAIVMLAGLLLAPPTRAQSRHDYEQARQQMVQSVLATSGVSNQSIIDAMLATPRHEFVHAALRPQAYLDMALPIGHQQTISSPFIVAFMTQALAPQPEDRVLEIGTGSGYQAAVLSHLVDEVYSIEIVPDLGRRAKRTLRRLRYKNVHVRLGDGYQGWPQQAPFDKIIVTCSPDRVPEPLVQQLREGGLIVIPVGERYQQMLFLLRKKDGKLQSEALRPTLFVPMTGAAAELRETQPNQRRTRLHNGSFEQALAQDQFVPGWYYQRQLTWVEDRLAPDGQHCIRFHNQDPGREAHLMQGFAVDGRQTAAIEVSVWIKTQNVHSGLSRSGLPMLNLSLFDDQRKEIRHVRLGPVTGTHDWHPLERKIHIPAQAREGLLRVGMFGATGTAWFDKVQLRPQPR